MVATLVVVGGAVVVVISCVVVEVELVTCCVTDGCEVGCRVGAIATRVGNVVTTPAGWEVVVTTALDSLTGDTEDVRSITTSVAATASVIVPVTSHEKAARNRSTEFPQPLAHQQIYGTVRRVDAKLTLERAVSARPADGSGTVRRR